METVQHTATIFRSHTLRMADLYKFRPKIHSFLKVALYDIIMLIKCA